MNNSVDDSKYDGKHIVLVMMVMIVEIYGNTKEALSFFT